MKRIFQWGMLAVLAVFATMAVAGHPLVTHDMLAAVGAVGIGMPMMFAGETSPLQPAIDLIEKQGRVFDLFKETNDALLKAKADGKSVAELQAKLDKIEAEMIEIRKQAAEAEKKAGRAALQGGGGEKNDTPEMLEWRQAFNRQLREGDVSKETMLALQRKAMSNSSDPDGGFLVLPELDMAIDRFMPVMSAMSRLARTVTIGTSKWQKMVKTSGMAMRRIANGNAGGETTEPKYSQVEIEVFTAEVEPWVQQETLDDARVDLESDLAMEAGIGFGEGAGSEFITGNGVGKARGITAYTNVANASYAWGSVGYILAGKSAAFASVAPSDKLIDLQHSLKAQYRPGAYWLTGDSTLAKMRQMKDGSGSYYLWQPDTTAGFGGRFLGSPVEIDDNMPVLAAGSYSLAYGNFQRGYTIVNRQGTTIIRDPFTSKGNVKFNFRRRFGGGINNFEAIKLMKFATS